MIQRPEAAFTHGGKFHADDVFSTALLRIVYPGLPVSRGFQVPADFNGLVFDIGGGAYDHHGPGAPVRENGVPYAAFGLLWRALGAGLVGEQDALYFDEHFVAPLDLDDNTGCGSSLAAAIGSFNPGWDSDADDTACFWQAEAFAEQVLRNRIDRMLGDARAARLVKAAFDTMENGIAVLPRFAPWKRTAKQYPKLLFVVYPSQRGGFAAQAVNDPASEEHALKCPFPAGWAGLRDEEAAKTSGIATLRFCHNSRFMITADTLEDAKEACLAAKRQAPVRLCPPGGFDLRAIVTDCDGTVVSELLHEPDASTLYELEQAKKGGAAVLVASGRILPIVPQGLRKTADYFICGNGALAADRNGRVLEKDEWTRRQVEELTAFCNETGGGLSFYFEESYGIYAGFQAFAAFYGAHVGRTDCMQDDWDQRRHLKEAPYGAFYIGTDEALAGYLATHPDLQAAPFMSGYYDIYKKTTNKARMIGRVLERAGLDWRSTIAFGDGANDVEMLQTAGLGYAMENARNVAKEAADATAPAVSENGVACVLRAIRQENARRKSQMPAGE